MLQAMEPFYQTAWLGTKAVQHLLLETVLKKSLDTSTKMYVRECSLKSCLTQEKKKLERSHILNNWKVVT